MQWIRRYLTDLSADWHRARARHPGLAIATLLVPLLALACAVAGGVWAVTSVSRGLPDEVAISQIGEMDQATAVYDHRDALAFTIFKEQRIDVPLSAISPHLVPAILAIEDRRFFEHRGIDPLRLVSAVLTDLRERRAAQGASTITQQLARTSFLTLDKTIRRKVQELILAARIERQYSKEQILELYLNKVYFGDGLYGIEAASRGYFGKHASELTVAEAALLAGLVKSPSAYAPTVGLDRAVSRRNVVLRAMLDTGALEREAFESARTAKVVLQDGLRNDEPHGLYFKEQVRRELVERFGWQRVYQGGLRVFSTIDMEMQEAADAAIANGLQAVEKRRSALGARRGAPLGDAAPAADDPLQAALVALDPATGHVRALIGGRDFRESSFNRAVQAERQPGSAFKPFVFAAALEAGFTPATMIRDLNVPVETLEGAWTPDDDHSEADELSVRTALRTSSNRAAVRLLQEVGIPKVVGYAKTLGVGDVPSVPSLALGSGEVTLQAMTAAYAAFATGGRVPTPILIRRVEDAGGRVLYASQESSTQAVSETTAFLMATLLADVVNAGTGARVRALGFTLPAAGKTGTTNDFHDAWFVGFTPGLAAGVWLGFDQPRTILANGYAGDVAVPVWAEFMKAATRGDKPRWLQPPPEVTTATVCRLTGLLASDGCDEVEVVAEDGRHERRSMVYTEYFARGTQPTAVCGLHPRPGFFGTIASAFTGGHTQPLPPPKIQEPPAAEPVVPAPAESVEAVEPPQKKRGFWSRLFGVGKDDENKPKGSTPRDRP